jgi:hypothetical protein
VNFPRALTLFAAASLMASFSGCAVTPEPAVPRSAVVMPAGPTTLPPSVATGSLPASVVAGARTPAYPTLPPGNRDPATMPYGPERDAALLQRFNELVLFSPQQAANYYDVLPLPDRRPEMVERLARELLLTNPSAGAAWLDQNNVPPVQRDQLLRDAGLLQPEIPRP